MIELHYSTNLVSKKEKGEKMKKFIKLLIFCSIISFILSSSIVYAKDVLLKVGMSGEDVSQVQTKLKELGYFNEKITGYYGEITKKAVEKYQKDRKFSVDGIVGPGTWSALVGTQISQKSQNNNQIEALVQVLKQGMTSIQIKNMQFKLKELGYFNEECTGYFGEVTKNAVKSFQKNNGCTIDGVVGNTTWNKIFGNPKKQTNTTQSQQSQPERTTSSRGTTTRAQALVSWSDASNIFRIGYTATVIDIKTGIKFNIKRSFGTNHADCETLTADDSAKMKKAFGGSWNWDRKAIILIVNGRQLAASMAGFPHAGVDSKPGLATVSNRSGGYGTGQNLDTIKGNNMNGHFDIHFLNSRTHGTNKVDSLHQAAVKKAADYIESN